MILYLIKKKRAGNFKNPALNTKNLKNESELLCFLIIYED